MVSVRRLFRGKALPLVYGAPAGIDYLQALGIKRVTIFFAPGRRGWRETTELVPDLKFPASHESGNRGNNPGRSVRHPHYFPVPDMGNCWGLLGSLSLMKRVPGLEPVSSGANLTCTVQLCPGPSVAEQLLAATI